MSYNKWKPIRTGAVARLEANSYIIASSWYNAVKLKNAERKVVDLFDGYHSIQDISEMTGLSTDFVKACFMKLRRKKLACLLEEWNVLRYCPQCELYVMRRSECPVCGSKLKYVPLSPPCDPRPLFGLEKKFVINLLTKNADISLSQDSFLIANTVFREQENKYIWEIIYRGDKLYDIVFDFKDASLLKVAEEVYKEHFSKFLYECPIKLNARSCLKGLERYVYLGDIRSLARKTKQFIIRQRRRHGMKYPPLVKFSGGKDSMVLLKLIEEAGIPVNVVFCNMGVECPHTVNFYKNLRQKMRRAIIKFYLINKPLFWDFFDERGPPSIYRRWCRELKFKMIDKFSEELYGQEQHISFDACRRYEENERRDMWLIHKNEHLRSQTIVHPLANWTALDIWGFSYWKNLPVNPLYFLGFERIACWLCPGNTPLQAFMVSKVYPALSRLFKIKLDQRGINNHSWRYQR